MNRRLQFALFLAGALALVPAAAAAVSVHVQVGDTIDVTTTKIGCFVQAADANKYRAIVCEISSNKGLVKNTYGIGIKENGATVVGKIDGKGTLVGMWASRGKASARTHAATYFQLAGGDSFGFAIKGGASGSIACKVVDIATGPTNFRGRRVVCFRTLKTRPVANSYGVVISDKFAGSLRFDAKGNPGATAFVRFQPS